MAERGVRALAAARLRWRTALSALLPLLTAGSALTAPLPGGFAHSGWYEFEIIVLADTRSEILESETWPMAASVAYPTRWRWLQDPMKVISLSEAYPEAHIAASSSGHLSVRLPQSPAPSWTAPEGLLTEGDLSLIDELIQLGEGTDTSAYRLSLETLSPATTDSEVEANEPDAPGPVLPFEEVTPAVPATPLTALESLGITERSSSNVAIPFAAPTVLPELLPVTVSARAIPMPQPFIRQPLAQLADGLTRYRRNNDDELIASASWLQGPGSEGLPILLEPDIESDYPSVQGFIQLLPRGNTWRLGINFWANTPGQYLPDFFEVPPPPPSPHRIAIIEAMPDLWSLTKRDAPPPFTLEDGMKSETGGAEKGVEATPGFPQTRPREDAVIGSESRLTPPTPTAQAGDASIPQVPGWPWRHVIHVADTVPLAENRLRYYDHPVIKVIALWRELTWYEVFANGKRSLSAPEAAAP